MPTTKAKAVGYWTVTLLILLPLAGSGFPELFGSGPAQTVESLHRLGYPLYPMKILGLSKILGAAALLANRPAFLVEWAYAGFSFLLLGASLSHLLAHDFIHAPIPLFIFAMLLVSHALHREVRTR